MVVDTAQRLLLVHAHPDDETIATGATMARYVDAGVHVTLITCTRGEQGEILVPELEHLAADRQDGLGLYRETELASAMAALGVRDHRFLGEAGHDRPGRVYRDSGMAYAEDGSVVPVPDPRPDAFALADVDEAAQRLADVVREIRPRALVTYEPGGGYGHPDHVQAHRVAMRAVELAAAAGGAGGSAWQVPKVYWVVLPESTVRRATRELSVAGANPFGGRDPDGPLPSMIVPDDQVTTRLDGTAFLNRKAEALRAHATQVTVDGAFFALSNGVGQPLTGLEYYRLAAGSPTGPWDDEGRETDLLAGT
jgi:N-acetyl-1-D-myo-inositol-2-amino-2-deoxy-alpha-D-glucopyranoside deacetylase